MTVLTLYVHITLALPSLANGCSTARWQVARSDAMCFSSLDRPRTFSTSLVCEPHPELSKATDSSLFDCSRPAAVLGNCVFARSHRFYKPVPEVRLL